MSLASRHETVGCTQREICLLKMWTSSRLLCVWFERIKFVPRLTLQRQHKIVLGELDLTCREKRKRVR